MPKGMFSKFSTVSATSVLAFLLILLFVGCGRDQAPATSPLVVSVTPANGAITVPVSSLLTATFNKAMNPTSLNTSSFTAVGPTGAIVTGAVSYSGTTATFTPATMLAASSMYTATISTGATDANGTALAGKSVWSFTTGTIPTVISTNPVNAGISIPINRKITATFSEAMNPTSVTAAGGFSLIVTTGGAPVPGTATFVAANNTVIFSPAANLLPNTQYTATISTVAHSAAGSGLAANYVFGFTTGASADLTAPTVISTVPASAAINVPTNQTVTATFSKPMDPSTITAAGTFTVNVAGVGGASVAGTVSYTGTTATFKPTANLTASTQFTAKITAAKDLSGNALAVGVASNPWSFTTGTGPNTTAPTVTLTNPANVATSVVLNKTVSATFSGSMDPLTITAPGTFTLAVAGVNGTPVTGTVTYDSQTNIATFTPSANLTATTQYTATVSKAAKDLAGNAVAAGLVPNPWNFTTGTTTGPVGPNLATAAPFGSFGGGAGITNQGINSVINGDIGTTGVSTLVTGFHDHGTGCIYTETTLNVGLVNGNIDTAPPPPTVACPSEGTAVTAAIAQQGALDALAAFNNISPASRPGGIDPSAGQLGAQVLAPGIYKAAGGSYILTGSDLTLDAQGDTNAIWIFQAASSLTVGGPGAPRNIILVNGAQAKNIFWYVGSSATINAAGGGTMVGTIIASAGVSFSTTGNVALVTLDGRALSLNASVTMVNTVVNVPAP